jgi:hypothetical protein
MAAREERWRFGKEDARPGSQDGGRGRKTEARDAKKTAVQERRALGKLEKRPGEQDGRPDGKKPGGTRKTVAGRR